jgi:hypothetical protein
LGLRKAEAPTAWIDSTIFAPVDYLYARPDAMVKDTLLNYQIYTTNRRLYGVWFGKDSTKKLCSTISFDFDSISMSYLPDAYEDSNLIKPFIDSTNSIIAQALPKTSYRIVFAPSLESYLLLKRVQGLGDEIILPDWLRKNLRVTVKIYDPSDSAAFVTPYPHPAFTLDTLFRAISTYINH